MKLAFLALKWLPAAAQQVLFPLSFETVYLGKCFHFNLPSHRLRVRRTPRGEGQTVNSGAHALIWASAKTTEGCGCWMMGGEGPSGMGMRTWGASPTSWGAAEVRSVGTDGSETTLTLVWRVSPCGCFCHCLLSSLMLLQGAVSGQECPLQLPFPQSATHKASRQQGWGRLQRGRHLGKKKKKPAGESPHPRFKQRVGPLMPRALAC